MHANLIRVNVCFLELWQPQFAREIGLITFCLSGIHTYVEYGWHLSFIKVCLNLEDECIDTLFISRQHINRIF
jgi:hypothetical protein